MTGNNKPQEKQPYNNKFLYKILKWSYNKINNTTGENTIHTRMLRRFHSETKTYILDLSNRIWREGKIPESKNLK